MNDDLLRWHRDRLGHVSEPREHAVRQAPKDVDGPDEGGNHAQLVQARSQAHSGYLRKAKRDRRSEEAAESATSWKEARCKHQSSHGTKVRTC